MKSLEKEFITFVTNRLIEETKTRDKKEPITDEEAKLFHQEANIILNSFVYKHVVSTIIKSLETKILYESDDMEKVFMYRAQLKGLQDFIGRLKNYGEKVASIPSAKKEMPMNMRPY